MKLKNFLARIIRRIKDNFSKKKFEIPEPVYEITFSDAIKQEVTEVIRKYGWNIYNLKKFIVDSIKTSTEFVKEIEDEVDPNLNIDIKKRKVFANENQSIKLQLVEGVNLCIILTIQDQIKTYIIGRKTTPSYMKDGILSEEFKKVRHGRVFTYKYGDYKIEETTNIGENSKITFTVYDASISIYQTRAISVLMKNIHNIEDKILMANEDTVMEIVYNEIKNIFSCLSTENMRNVSVRVEQYKVIGDSKIKFSIFETNKFKHKEVNVEENNESITIKSFSPINWIYKNGKIILEYTEELGEYKITLVNKEEDITKMELETQIKCAIKLANSIKIVD